MNINIKEWRSR